MLKREFEITLKFGDAKFTASVTGIGALLSILEQTMAELGNDSSEILDVILELSSYLDEAAPLDFVAADDIFIKSNEVIEEMT